MADGDKNQNWPGWTPQTEKAAALVATSTKTRAQIAKACGVEERTLYRWLREPEFVERIDEHRARVREDLIRRGIARVENRVEELEWLKDATKRVIKARAKRAREARAHQADDPESNDLYGLTTPEEAETGLMVREVKTGADGLTVRWQYDTGPLDMLLKLHAQTAKELGQWTDKAEVEFSTRAIELVGVDVDNI